MGNTWGRQVLGVTAGQQVQVSADGKPEWLPIGATIDWSTVAAVSADTTYLDGITVKNGQKALRYGQVMCEITTAEVQTVDLSGADDPNGGTWDMTILGQTITGIAYNVTAAALEALIRALAVEGAAGVLVTKSSFVYTITFPNDLNNVAAITASGTNLTTGGSTITITIATTTSGITAAGKFGPYDSGASDGRQTLSQDRLFILNHTILENGGIPGLTAPPSNHVGGLVGGAVWRDRVIAHATTASLANGPTLAALQAAMPRLSFVFNH